MKTEISVPYRIDCAIIDNGERFNTKRNCDKYRSHRAVIRFCFPESPPPLRSLLSWKRILLVSPNALITTIIRIVKFLSFACKTNCRRPQPPSPPPPSAPYSLSPSIVILLCGDTHLYHRDYPILLHSCFKISACNFWMCLFIASLRDTIKCDTCIKA